MSTCRSGRATTHRASRRKSTNTSGWASTWCGRTARGRQCRRNTAPTDRAGPAGGPGARAPGGATWAARALRPIGRT
eukprot:11771816-Alexandrium_andersonii.AAC.1